MPPGQNARNTVMFASFLALPKIEGDGELRRRDNHNSSVTESDHPEAAHAGNPLLPILWKAVEFLKSVAPK